MSRPTFLAHRVTVLLMVVVVLVVSGDGFVQSYAGLHEWALEHHLAAWKADSFPLLVDLFIGAGELGLFALALEGHRLRRSGLAWIDMALPFGIAAAGWGVSLVFNVGSVGHRFADQATAAVPPVASMLGLLVLLRTLHRLVTRAPERDEMRDEKTLAWWPLPSLPPVVHSPVDESEPGVPDVPEGVLAEAAEVFAEDLAGGRVPGIRPIKERLGVGQDRAKQVQAHLSVLAAR